MTGEAGPSSVGDHSSRASAEFTVVSALIDDVGFGLARLAIPATAPRPFPENTVVSVRGGRRTLAVVGYETGQPSGFQTVRLDAVTQENAGTFEGATVEVRTAVYQDASQVTLSITKRPRTIGALDEATRDFVKEAIVGRPVAQGDVVVVPGLLILGGAVRFRVDSTSPGRAVRITSSTDVSVQFAKGRTIGPQGETKHPLLSDLGGMDEVITKVLEIVQFSLRFKEFYDVIDRPPPRGILLYGPPGTGKTTLMKAISNHLGVKLFLVDGADIIGSGATAGEQTLEHLFDRAAKEPASIIFFDEVDSIAPRRDNPSLTEAERRVVAKLLTLMDGVKGRGNTIVVGATNRLNHIDPAMRRKGRFDRDILVDLPSEAGRLQILKLGVRRIPLEDAGSAREETLLVLARETHGFGASDLDSLIDEAVVRSIERWAPSVGVDLRQSQRIPPALLNKIRVSREDLLLARARVVPSSQRTRPLN